MIKRYIRTEINDKNRIMEMDSCNLCPLLSFDHNNKIVSCLKYNRPYKDINPNKSNIIKNSTNGFKFCRGIHLPLEKIEIPDWCGLSNDITSIQPEIYVKTGENDYKKYYGYLSNYHIVRSKDIDYDRCFIKLIEEKTKSKINTNFKNETNTNTTPPILLTECSYCGEKTNNVSRNKNFGMCEKCWNLYKENKEKKYLSYINNFRLKRKTTRLQKIDKKVGNLNIF